MIFSFCLHVLKIIPEGDINWTEISDKCIPNMFKYYINTIIVSSTSNQRTQLKIGL